MIFEDLDFEMEHEMNDVINLFKYFKKTKQFFCEFVNYLNNNKIVLNESIREHLKVLIDLWNCNKDVKDLNYYFRMKYHHHYINGKIENKELADIWKKYITSGLEARVYVKESFS